MKEEALCWFAGLHQLPSGHTGGCGPSPWRLSSRLGVGDQEWSLKRPTPHAQPSTAPAAWPDQGSSMLSLHVGTRVSWIQLARSGASGAIHVWTADTVAGPPVCPAILVCVPRPPSALGGEAQLPGLVALVLILKGAEVKDWGFSFRWNQRRAGVLACGG